MINDAIRIALAYDATTLRRVSLLAYNELAPYDSPSYFKLCAISRAAGILAARKKSIRRGFITRTVYAFRLQRVSGYWFKIEDGDLHLAGSMGYHFGMP